MMMMMIVMLVLVSSLTFQAAFGAEPLADPSTSISAMMMNDGLITLNAHSMYEIINEA